MLFFPGRPPPRERVRSSLKWLRIRTSLRKKPRSGSSKRHVRRRFSKGSALRRRSGISLRLFAARLLRRSTARRCVLMAAFINQWCKDCAALEGFINEQGKVNSAAPDCAELHAYFGLYDHDAAGKLSDAVF